jgi:hypothetical protein
MSGMSLARYDQIDLTSPCELTFAAIVETQRAVGDHPERVFLVRMAGESLRESLRPQQRDAFERSRLP